MMSVGAADYDISRLGMEVFRASPRQADLMIVAGRVSQKMAPVLRQVYDQMMEPKWVISMGVCASTGGMFNNYAIVQGVDQIVPVDVYAPGCPPSPETLLHAILTLHEKIRTGEITRRPASTAPPASRRPAGWVPDRARRRAGGHAAMSDVAPTAAPAPAPSGRPPRGAARCPTASVDQLAFPRREHLHGAWWPPSATPASRCAADLCAVDYLTHPGRSLPDGRGRRALRGRGQPALALQRQRVRVRVQVPEADPARRLASSTSTRAPRPWSARPTT